MRFLMGDAGHVLEHADRNTHTSHHALEKTDLAVFIDLHCVGTILFDLDYWSGLPF
jgi:hypothetical protein